VLTRRLVDVLLAAQWTTRFYDVIQWYQQGIEK
jgi:hypothetical protein